MVWVFAMSEPLDLAKGAQQARHKLAGTHAADEKGMS
jgi:hypothetical protein